MQPHEGSAGGQGVEQEDSNQSFNSSFSPLINPPKVHCHSICVDTELNGVTATDTEPWQKLKSLVTASPEPGDSTHV